MTIEELLEIEAIKNTRHLYSHYYDGNKLDELVSLFTDDAVCEFGPEFGGDWVGKDQIRAKYKAERDKRLRDENPSSISTRCRTPPSRSSTSRALAL